MINFLKTKLWPVVAGFVAASLVMLAFEFTNSFIFPFPPGLDKNNTEAVRAFAASMPWTAYIMVFLGWQTGAFVGGFLTSRLAKAKAPNLAIALGVLLFLAGWSNYLMLMDRILFYIVSTPLMAAAAVFGHKIYRKNNPA